MFHFILDEIGVRVVGTHNDLRKRRRLLARTVAHKSVKLTLDKVRGAAVDTSVADFLRPRGGAPTPFAAPGFARELAKVFSDAQAKRHDADYDLNVALSEADARLLRVRIRRAIASWRAATSASDKDFKHALCLLILLRGQLRSES